MTDGIFSSAILGPLLSDAAVEAHFSDLANVAAMVRVESALARAEARCGLIPQAAAERIAKGLAGFHPDLSAIGAGTAASGVPVIELVRQLRLAVGGEAAQALHHGATSQDIVDTGLLLRLRDVVAELRSRLDRVIGQLCDLADGSRDAVMPGRTRFQQALPISFGLKAAGWLAPLLRHRRRLGELETRLFQLQFGGAAGTLAALGDKGMAVAAALAEELDLGLPAMPWHSQRDNLAEFAGWLSLVSGSLGKFGQDFVLMAQSEVGEASEQGEGLGGSSTMPQKSNPVTGEVLISLARHNATLLSAMHQALLQEHERGGPGWQLEWLTLPQMCVGTAAALRHAEALLSRLEIDRGQMHVNLGEDGLILAEAATFALSAHMPRTEAQRLVKEACIEVAGVGGHLVDVLRAKVETPIGDRIDWHILTDPAHYLGVADAFIDAVLREAGR